jgi:hypothetical protein
MAISGTAEAVPFQNTIYATGSRRSLSAHGAKTTLDKASEKTS